MPAPREAGGPLGRARSSGKILLTVQRTGKRALAFRSAADNFAATPRRSSVRCLKIFRCLGSAPTPPRGGRGAASDMRKTRSDCCRAMPAVWAFSELAAAPPAPRRLLARDVRRRTIHFVPVGDLDRSSSRMNRVRHPDRASTESQARDRSTLDMLPGRRVEASPLAGSPKPPRPMSAQFKIERGESGGQHAPTTTPSTLLCDASSAA